MKVNLEHKDFTQILVNELGDMRADIRPQMKSALSKSVKLIKKNVKANLPKSDLNAPAKNYDGTPYIHMRDDIITIVKDDKDGSVFGMVGGGKHTGYKWHMLENGTSDTKAIHFIDKAMKQSDAELDAYIDEAIGRAVQGGD